MKAPKASRPLKRGVAFVARDAKGAVLLVKRPEKGLLASMLEPPQGVWGEDFPSRDAALKQAPFAAAWKKRPGLVRHGFTHFELEVEVYFAEIGTLPPARKNLPPGTTSWVHQSKLRSVALPTVMRKIVEYGLDEGGPLFAAIPRRNPVQTSSARRR